MVLCGGTVLLSWRWDFCVATQGYLPLAPCPQTPLGCFQGPQRAHLLPHDARFSLEPQVGLLFISELSLVLSFDVLDLPVFIFFNLLLGFLKFPKLLPNIFLCLPWWEGGRERESGEMGLGCCAQRAWDGKSTGSFLSFFFLA